jgi:hypothetical protein
MKNLIAGILLGLAIAASGFYVVSPAFSQPAPDPAVTVTETDAVTNVAAPDAENITVAVDEPNTTVSAPDAETVVIPYGNWIEAVLDRFLQIIVAAAMVAITIISRSLPKWLVPIVGTFLTEQNISRGISYGANMVKGATKDKTLSVDVGSQVVAQAVQYVINSAPAFLIKFMGGEEGIRDKVLARINFAESADAASLSKAGVQVST